MTSTVLLCTAVWLLTGAGVLAWFHSWRAGRGYAKRWHMALDYILIVAMGLVSLTVAILGRRQFAQQRRMGGWI